MVILTPRRTASSAPRASGGLAAISLEVETIMMAVKKGRMNL